MAEVKSESQVKLISWPSPQDYNEAIQNLRENTQDTHLQDGHVHLTQLGLPRPLTGAFASVYRVDCPNNSIYAVRCFLRDMSDQEARYQHISQFVQNDSLPYTVTFDFLRQGIRVGANWFPALKMDWVAGPNLDQYIAQHIHSPHALDKLADAFEVMCKELRAAGIAHGDLQHGNIILSDGELRLVDYDGMYVPAMKGMLSNEIGHRNFQHPARSAQDFGPHLDNFSAWVIDTSIRILVRDPHLWKQLGGGDDCLLFRRDDFAQPEYSYAFHRLENHSDEEIRTMAKRLRWLAHQKISDIPYLDPKLHLDTSTLPELVAPSHTPKTVSAQPASTPLNLPYDLVDPEDEEVSEAPIPRWNPALMQQYQNNAVLAIEPELNQPRPRWTVERKHVPNRTMFDRELVESGRPTRTTHLELKKEIVPGTSTMEQYILRYTFEVNNQQFFKEQVIDDMEAFKYAAMKEATVLYEPNNPNNHILYCRSAYSAVAIKVPANIEPELRARKRKTVDRPNSESETEVPIPTVVLVISALLLLLGNIVSHSDLGVGLAIVLGLIGLVYAVAAVPRQQKLVEYGVPVQARVLDITPLEEKGGWTGSPLYKTALIRYRYQSHDHHIVTKTVNTSDPDLRIAKVGSKFTVLYDIQNPENHVVYKLSRYKAL